MKPPELEKPPIPEPPPPEAEPEPARREATPEMQRLVLSHPGVERLRDRFGLRVSNIEAPETAPEAEENDAPPEISE
jgi:hypothetical protein